MDSEIVPQNPSKDQAIKILFFLGVLLSCLIILVNQNLPFLDYPNHLARYYLLTRDYGTPFYHQFYINNFKIIPNIGVDVLMAGLGRVFEPSMGLRILLAGTILSASTGYAKLSFLRNNGLWHPAVILIPLTLYSYSLVLGFLNFVLAASILPWAIFLYEKYPSVRTRCLTVFGFCLVLFFCHLMVAVLLLIVVGSKLLSTANGREKMIGFASIIFCAVVMAALLKVSSVSGEASTVVFSTIGEKVKVFFSCMAFGPWWSITNGLTFVGFVLIIVLGYLNLDREDRIVLGCMLAFYLVCPFGFKITANMDGRIPALVFSLYLAMARYRSEAPGRKIKPLALGLFVILLVNLISIYMVIKRSDKEARKMREILRQIPTGDALFISDISQWRADHRANWYPAYRMLPFYTAIDRPLFISGVFAFPSQQPVILKPELVGVGYATRQYKKTDSVEFQVNASWKEIQPRLERIKVAGVKRSWIFFVNYESTGYAGIKIPNTVYEDKNYLLVHVDN